LGFPEYASTKHLAEMQRLTALSIGCGTGHNELDWARLGRFQKLDGIDVSRQRIGVARQAAVSENLDSILHFRIGAIHDLKTAEESYDVILAIQAMHHFSPLRPLLERLSRLLKPKGLLFANEFVGPNRFQWTSRQMEGINGLLKLLPSRLRVEWGGKRIKERVVRPSRLSMILSDPSESVESSHILPLLHELFDVVEIRNYGGALLHMLLQGIAHNFRSDDAEAQRYLRLFFEAEDLMMQSGEIQSDFAVVVCRKREPKARSLPSEESELSRAM
jgi:SAM-dependent methyltransferase